MKFKLIRVLFFSTVLYFSHSVIYAQYSNDYAMRSYNLFFENPAYAGAADLYNISTSYRKQWTGIEGSPERFYLTFNKPFKRKHVLAKKNDATKEPHHGMGLKLENNKVGFINGISLEGCYAYHIPVFKKFMLAGGIGFGFQNYKIDGNQYNFVFTTSDPVVTTLNHFMPDGEIGINLYSPKFFISGALRQIISDGYSFSNSSFSIDNNSKQLVTAIGCSLSVMPKLKMIPTVLNRSNFKSPFTTEAVLNFEYNKFIYFGLGYRHQIATSLNIGFRVMHSLDFIYSYDYTISELSGLSGSSHEILLRLHKPTPIKVDYPSDYW